MKLREQITQCKVVYQHRNEINIPITLHVTTKQDMHIHLTSPAATPNAYAYRFRDISAHQCLQVNFH